jgi:hypothetical protein
MKTTRPVLAVLLAASLPIAWAPLNGTATAAARGDTAGLDDLAFMAGCWQGTYATEDGMGTIEEHYTTPSENLMLGTTRYLVQRRTVMFEFLKLESVDGRIILTPFPGGRASEHGFELARLAQGDATFEAPEHDFPKRIRYRREGGTLIARIDDGTDGNASEWRMSTAPCY